MLQVEITETLLEALGKLEAKERSTERVLNIACALLAATGSSVRFVLRGPPVHASCFECEHLYSTCRRATHQVSLEPIFARIIRSVVSVSLFGP